MDKVCAGWEGEIAFFLQEAWKAADCPRDGPHSGVLAGGSPQPRMPSLPGWAGGRSSPGVRDRSKPRHRLSPSCIQALLNRSSCVAAAVARGEVGVWGVTWSPPRCREAVGWVDSADEDEDSCTKAASLDALSLRTPAIKLAGELLFILRPGGCPLLCGAFIQEPLAR